MSKGLNIATNYYNRIQAWRDWQRLADQCDSDLVDLYQPPEDAGWRTIDKQIAKLRFAQNRRNDLTLGSELQV